MGIFDKLTGNTVRAEVSGIKAKDLQDNPMGVLARVQGGERLVLREMGMDVLAIVPIADLDKLLALDKADAG